MRFPTCLLIILVSCSTTHADVSLNVTVANTAGLDNPFTDNLESSITSHMQAAFDIWLDHIELPADDRSIEAIVNFNSPIGTRGGGRSLSSGYVGFNGERHVWEAGLAHELHAIDTNGDDFDIEILFEPAYLEDLMWFDPEPNQRTAKIPNNRIDAMSFFLHEIGHAFGFSGWQNNAGGFEPFDGTFESTFDELAILNGDDWTFHGASAMELYRGPVPLTSQASNNQFHIGNSAPKEGSELIGHLMNGVVFHFSRRYSPSMLELAMLEDIGVNVQPFAGDFDLDRQWTFADIDTLSSKVRDQSTEFEFDLDHNGIVDVDDRIIWINNIKRTYFGDSNLDGEFNSSDLVTVFTGGQYEDGLANNSTWQTGDWNGDAEFDSGDLVVAFEQGGFEAGPRVMPVPEPKTLIPFLLSLFAVRFYSQRHKQII